MTEIWLAILLGIVEGVTEFLPVSSTAHLRISQAWLGLSLEDAYWKLFAVFIQLGAILAVVVLYRQKLLEYSHSTFQTLRQNPSKLTTLPTFFVAIAFLVTVIPVYFLNDLIGDQLESMKVISYSLLVGGIVMIVFEYLFRKPHTESVETMKSWQAVVIGLVQITSAVFPGTSRSMSTILGGQLVGLSRSAALDFSFLVSIPVMAAATMYDLLKYIKNSEAALTTHQVVVLSVGFFVSFAVAVLVIRWFLAYVKSFGFIPFGIYRIALGGALLVWGL